MSQFVQRNISITLQTPEGATYTLPDGLRAEVNIQNAGGIALESLNARVWGMTQDLMNKFTTLGRPSFKVKNNLVSVAAGELNGQMANVFQGVIQQAWASAEGVPDVPFIIEAYAGLVGALKPNESTSIKGQADAAFLISGLANKLGYQFQNHGVSGVMLTNPNYPGPIVKQIQDIARDGHFNQTISNNTVHIWPMNGSIDGQNVEISRDEGMVGFPVWSGTGLIITTEFNPNIIQGAALTVKDSVISSANGTWTVIKLDHELQSQMPNGNWFTRVEMVVPGGSTTPS